MLNNTKELNIYTVFVCCNLDSYSHGKTKRRYLIYCTRSISGKPFIMYDQSHIELKTDFCNPFC